MKKSKCKLAYLAGLIDGEGCINLSNGVYKDRPGKHYQLRLTIYNTNSNLTVWIGKEFGGITGVGKSQKLNWKAPCRWHIISERAKEILKLTLPYLVIKRQQAVLGIAFQELISNRHATITGRKSLTATEQQQREELISLMHTLNKKGV